MTRHADIEIVQKTIISAKTNLGKASTAFPGIHYDNNRKTLVHTLDFTANHAQLPDF